MASRITKHRGIRVIVVLPAYNAAKTLKKTYFDIPKDRVDKIILVDDGSSDTTVKVAKKIGLKTVSHPQNRGYGGNQKTCYTLALDEGADIIVMIHPDYQYDATLTGDMVKPIIDGRVDLMLGSRIRSRKEALAGGMPLYKYLGNRFLTILENIVLGLNLSEYHTGFRAYSRELLKVIPFHKFSDNFVFDQEMLIATAAASFSIGEIAVPVRYFPEASSINLRNSTIYGMATIWRLILYLLYRIKIFRSAIFSTRK